VCLPLCLSHAYSYRKLSDVAEGLCYLHSRNMVHGDLKGVRSRPKPRPVTTLTPDQPNILIGESGHARIADFGQTKVTQCLDTIRSASRHGNTPRWAAPEVLEEQPPSKESDIFSYAMVMVEVRMDDPLCPEVWLTVRSNQYRYTPAQFRSALVQLSCQS